MTIQKKTCPVCHTDADLSVSVCPRDGALLPLAQKGVSLEEPAPASLVESTQTAATNPPLELVGLTQRCPVCALETDLMVEVCPRDGTALNPITVDPVFRGKYEYIDVIGAGGMGVIYRARHLVLNRVVAIKMVHARLESPEAIMRFQIEGKATSLLSHPYIVAIQDFGTASMNQPYMVMDFVEGETLAHILKRERCLSIPRFLKLAEQICSALAHAHNHLVLHRDIKPSNIMIVDDRIGNEQIRVMDFGIAKLLDDGESAAQHLTRTGTALGSPLYMSPEQARGEKVDLRSDLYSLGCVMYECLTGVPPLAGETAFDTMILQMDEPPRSMKEANPSNRVEPAIEEMVMRLLEKQPANRYQSSEELLKDLVAFENARAAGKKLKLQSKEALTRHIKSGQKSVKPVMVVTCVVVVVVVIIAAAVVFTAQFTKLANQKDTPPLLTNNQDQDSSALLTSLLKNETVNLREFLKKRDVEQKPVSDKDLAPLLGATRVKNLIIERASLTDNAFAYLRNLKELQTLDLSRNGVSKLPGIDNFSKLTDLRLNSTGLDSTGMSKLKALRNLQRLELRDTDISDQDLQCLYQLKNLDTIDIKGCSKLNPAAILALHQKRPNLMIVSDTNWNNGLSVIPRSAP